MLPPGFETAILAIEGPIINALNCTATGIGCFRYLPLFLYLNSFKLVHTCPFLYTESLRIFRTVGIPFLFAVVLKIRRNRTVHNHSLIKIITPLIKAIFFTAVVSHNDVFVT